MRVDTETDLEIRLFLAKWVHDIGHRVGLLQSLAHTLKQTGQGREIQALAEITQHISEVSHNIARHVRMIRLMIQQELVDCDFLRDVLQPAVWLADRGEAIRRLRIDQSARNAPEVTVRPTLAILGLMPLLSDGRSITLLCDIGKTKDRVILRIQLEQAPRDATIKRGIRFLRAAGAYVTPSAAGTGYSLALSFRQRHNKS